eukprot:287957-Prymnesium_polylepis.1
MRGALLERLASDVVTMACHCRHLASSITWTVRGRTSAAAAWPRWTHGYGPVHVNAEHQLLGALHRFIGARVQ